mgnify:FL=1
MAAFPSKVCYGRVTQASQIHDCSKNGSRDCFVDLSQCGSPARLSPPNVTTNGREEAGRSVALEQLAANLSEHVLGMNQQPCLAAPLGHG